MQKNQNNKEQAILLGVPRVQYSPEGVTPFPMCLKACANYMGIDTEYDYVMAASGAAFRLTWDETCWNLGNVDSIFTYDNWERVFRQGVEALGCSFRILPRREQTKKSEFAEFIKEQIDKGNPVIGLGIIGPPEACIITGYRDGGDTLLGWNFFQDNPEFNHGVTFDESGYYITDKWWENEETLAVIALEAGGEKQADIKTILNNGIQAMEGRKHGNFTKGLWAWDAWITAVEKDGEFSKDMILPLLAERLWTHGDAIDCIADGRYHAAVFLKKAAEQDKENKIRLEEAAKYFMNIFEIHKQLFEVLGGWERGEVQMRNFAEPEVRKKTVSLLRQAKENDEKAFKTIKELVEIL